MAEVAQKLNFFQRLGNSFAAFRGQTVAVGLGDAMGVLEEIETRNRQQLLSQFTSDSWLWNSLSLSSSSSGQPVNQNTALAIPAFYRGVKVIAETISTIKWDVEEVDKDGNIKKLPTHPVAKLLNNPSPRYNKVSFLETVSAYREIQGNGYAFISRNKGNARPVELRIVAPEDCKPFLNGSGELMYQVRGKGGQLEVVEYTEMLHLPNMMLTPDNLEGISPIAYHRNTLGLSLAMTDWTSKSYKDSAPINGMLTTDKPMSAEQMSQTAKSWKSGRSKGDIPVIANGLKYQAITLSPEDMQAVESYKLTVEDISRILGVPLPFLSALDRATFSNIEELGRWFVTYTIRPRVKQMEAEFDRKLLYDREQGRIRVRANMESLLRGSVQAQADFLQKMVIAGVMSRNEARKNIGLNTREGLDEMPMPVQFQQQPEQTEEENEDQ